MAIEDSTITLPERETVAKGVYDHLLWLCETDAASERSFLQKVYKFLTIHLVLFAALSYGFTKLEGMNHWISLCAMGIGLIAVITIGIGFDSVIVLIHISDKSVVGITKLQDQIKKKTIVKFPSDKFWMELGQNLSAAILENRESDNQLKTIAARLNHCTRIGYWLVALFVIMVTCCEFVLQFFGVT